MAQMTLRDYLQEAEDAIRDDRIDDALTHCRNILIQFPESLEAQRLLGEAYLAQGQLEEAQQSFDWILTNDPENVVAYCNRALICERSLDYDTALDCYQQAYELSHGNSQIRQEFNRLSAEIGPQGFMFSRAGLARLYMRGDLLTQAIQEWETVLAVSPERLDARTGLLETCWREAHYDRVEQLATQILQDVPGCLKALFLLAYVNSAKNIQQAQELLKRAEVLDPDLLMAQELFSDMMARQPADPFLELLKKAPITIETAQPQSAVTLPPGREKVLAQPISIPATTLSSESLAGWNSVETATTENWGGDVTLIKGMQQEKQQATEPPPQPEEQSLETWMSDPSLYTTTENNQKEALALDSSRSYNGLQEPGLKDDTWANPSREKTMSSPPPWLNMLTQREIQQLNDGEVPPEPSPVEEPVASPSPVQSLPKEKSEGAVKARIDEEEEFSFGPEWLKSLGAAPIEDEISTAEASPLLSSPPAQAPMPEVRQPSSISPLYEPQQPAAYEASTNESALQPFSEKFADPVGTVEYDVLTTLEGLDAGLRSQGFVPLSPNTLQTIAKTHEEVSPAVPKTPELTIPEEEEFYQQEGLPSAIAELGNFPQEPVNSFPEAVSSVASSQMMSNAAFEEPAWLASLNVVPTPSSVAEKQQEMLARQEEQIYSTLPPVQSSWAGTYMPYETPLPSSTQEEVSTRPQVHSAQPTQPLPGMPSWFQEKEPAREEDRIDSTLSDTAQPAWPQMNRPQEALAAQPSTPSTYSAMGAWARLSNNDVMLNSELETTMKRPAVRLQPMQQPYSFAQNDQEPLPTRSRMAEPIYGGRSAESNMSQQERLLKGYQHQLVGDYDEAMQEYRIIIRNSPELLGEVVSNVRALLKLAPKYSTGYRVLGDAYMRQGEYLQAMEAYNKALTMAKRAKS